MSTCGYDKHSVWGRLIEWVSGTALLLHIAGHLLPLLLVFGNAGMLTWFAESRLLMVTALAFVPISLWHLVRDRSIHAELHRLQHIENEYLELVWKKHIDSTFKELQRIQEFKPGLDEPYSRD